MGTKDSALRNGAQSAAEAAADRAADIASRTKREGQRLFERGHHSAVDQIDQVAQALNRAGEELTRHQPSVSNYTARIAAGIGTLADRLREAKVDEIVTETRDLARRNPALFLVGGVAIGFALSRFLKASAHRRNIGTDD